jgi:hypothetical protein
VIRDDASRVKPNSTFTTLSEKVHVLPSVSAREPSDRVFAPVPVRPDDSSVTAAAKIVAPVLNVRPEEVESMKVDPTFKIIAGAIAVVQDTVAKFVRASVPAEYPCDDAEASRE